MPDGPYHRPPSAAFQAPGYCSSFYFTKKTSTPSSLDWLSTLSLELQPSQHLTQEFRALEPFLSGTPSHIYHVQLLEFDPGNLQNKYVFKVIQHDEFAMTLEAGQIFIFFLDLFRRSKTIINYWTSHV